MREAFDLLFALLRHIDACEDDVIFFADEGGSWQVGVSWKNVLPAYFRCLAETAGPEEFAREVGAAIKDFAIAETRSTLGGTGEAALAQETLAEHAVSRDNITALVARVEGLAAPGPGDRLETRNLP